MTDHDGVTTHTSTDVSIDISIVVTDLDGTFWHTDDSIASEVIDAVKTLEQRGIPFLVATGRRLNSTRRPLEAVGLRPPVIVLNGALGVDLSSMDRFHVRPYPSEEARSVLDAFRAVGLDPVVYIDDPEIEAFVSTEPSTHPDHVHMLQPNLAVDDLERVTAEERVLGFSLIGVPHERAAAAQRSIGPLAESHLDRSIDFPGLATFTVAPNNQSKWDGVVAFCERHGIDSSGVVALGDGTNDLELLGNAAIALAPSDAHDSVLDLADRVIPTAAEGGWASVLDVI